ncbi:MAG TPA: hypothetical protein VLU54_17275 [Casimicrobiaceae bacterium]|nr:hypothetical protein [Casimicrobiaceae bacterium]
MDTRAPNDIFPIPSPDPAATPGGRRALRHALVLLVATAIAWLVFAAYRQPEFILDVASLRLC